MKNEKISDAIMQLHAIARLVESEIGNGALSDDIRQCGDRLNVLLKPYLREKEIV
jgi:hypothetical protein